MTTKVKRSIIQIDEDKCNGCGLCVPSCAEGAIQIVDGKARLVSEKFCDGLGACLGECPEGALEVIEREAEDFDEEAVKAHLEVASAGSSDSAPAQSRPSMLGQWPVQLMLVPADAPYFQNADLLVCADCVPFALADFHGELLKGKTLVVGCPKLDDVDFYVQKLKAIFSKSRINSVTVAVMEVPCCNGLLQAVYEAADASGKVIPVYPVKVGIKGQILERTRTR
jgi:Pyruvate/2-oxoacid:ferredoxin oxidoreductase delta subunit